MEITQYRELVAERASIIKSENLKVRGFAEKVFKAGIAEIFAKHPMIGRFGYHNLISEYNDEDPNFGCLINDGSYIHVFDKNDNEVDDHNIAKEIAEFFSKFEEEDFIFLVGDYGSCEFYSTGEIVNDSW